MRTVLSNPTHKSTANGSRAKRVKKPEAETLAAQNKRIYEVAREFNLSSVAMVEVIRGLGYDVKNHMAVCAPEMLESVQKKFEEERSASRQEMKRKDIQQKERAQKERQAAAEKKTTRARQTARVVDKKEDKQEDRPRRRRPGRPQESIPRIEDASGQVIAPKASTDLPKSHPVAPARHGGGKRRRRRRGRPTVDQREVEESVRRTMAQMEGGARQRRRRRREEGGEEEEAEDRLIRVNEFTTVGELAGIMDVPIPELIKQCLQMGIMVTINQRLDMETITLVADEFGLDVEEQEAFSEAVLEEQEEEEGGEMLPRPPVVTIMGHVDHGKTSLLDYVRRTNVVAGEAGGITQHIGAYHVELENGRVVTFLDTPGHEAFTAMRARGAQVTDVVVLVVAADDSVMPQTLEAIDHARAANVPIALAINKIDLPAANPDRIKRQLTEHNIVVEEFGGKVQCCEVSASTGQDVNELLELLALETDLLELKANPESRVKGTIIEARLDRGRGNVATVLIQSGTLRVGDPFITGLYSGRVRAMLDERGNPVGAAGPSVPVQVLGLDGLPQAGDLFHVVPNDRQARELSQRRQQLRRERDVRRGKRMSLVDIRDQIQAGKIQELRLILKADVDGSVEALHDALSQISSEEVKLNVIHRGVGAISESDVLLASASDAVIIGFNIRPDARGREVATREGVDIWLYRVIYEAVEDIKAALSGLLAPKVDEHILGSAEIRETFQVSRFGTIAGCYVDSGAIRRDSRVRVLRDNAVVFEGQLASLKRFKDDVREVQSGFECGMRVENFNDIKIGDTIEAYEMVETARSL